MWKIYKNKIFEFDQKNLNQFLKFDFIYSFYQNDKDINNILFIKNQTIIYANSFILDLKKGIKYSHSNLIVKLFLRLVEIRILFLGNWYLNNFSFFQLSDKVDVSELVFNLKNKFQKVLIPDFLMNQISNNKSLQFIKLRIEDDMIFKISKNWKNIEDYKNALKTKYKKRINYIVNKSSKILVRPLKYDELYKYDSRMQKLFDQVVDNLKFSGPQFNVKILLSLAKKKKISIYGYFKNEELLAFSTYLNHNKDLVSYYVGYDKLYNNEYSLYSKILYETIRIGIDNQYEKIIFGRTANEFKSNFGAIPLKSYLYIKFKSRFMHFIFKIILENTIANKWIQRKPFKKTII